MPNPAERQTGDCFMEENIVEQLLRGSDNIDRMRKEVECVVRMIIGLLELPRHETVVRKFENRECKWMLIWYKEGSCLRRELPVVQCWLKREYGSRLAYSTDSGEINSFCMEVVQEVHQNLSGFVYGMLKDFSELCPKIRPFLVAAYKFSPTK